jgi:hypothetical protein
MAIIKTDRELLVKIREAQHAARVLGNLLDLINEAEVMEEDTSTETTKQLNELLQSINYDIVEHDLVGG